MILIIIIIFINYYVYQNKDLLWNIQKILFLNKKMIFFNDN